MGKRTRIHKSIKKALGYPRMFFHINE
jgi:hypothetical protein